MVSLVVALVSLGFDVALAIRMALSMIVEPWEGAADDDTGSLCRSWCQGPARTRTHTHTGARARARARARAHRWAMWGIL